jgi:anthranilate synthase component 1
LQIPLWKTEQRELLADLETPVSAFLKLRRAGARYLLETVEAGAVLGRYSFIGLHPLLEIECTEQQASLRTPAGTVFTLSGRNDPSQLLHCVLRLMQPAASKTPGNLLGGAVGYLGWEYLQFLENVPTTPAGADDPPLARFLIPQSLVTFDHLSRKLFVRSMLPDTGGEEAGSPQDVIEKAAQEALAAAVAEVPQEPQIRVQQMLDALRGGLPRDPDEQTPPPFQPVANPSQEIYEAAVEKAKAHIRDGDIFQAVLSQRLGGDLGVSPFQVYRALRMLNPSPYLFYIDFSPTVLVGSSPEVLVKLEGREATVRPIAGTRARGQDAHGDRVLAEELLGDEKERAEHVMLVDLGRNDLGRVCDYGTVQVTDFMTIERYSHVMHLVSYVRGRLREGLDRFDLLRATFPAGTVSGAPKVRAMEIIHELEGFRRGPYAGAVGYFGPAGEMDLCITIRTILCQGQRAILQAGAGIVADSQPVREHRECHRKMGALLDAIRLSEEGLP